MDSVLKFLIKLQADSGNVTAVGRQTVEQLDRIGTRGDMVGTKLRRAFSFSSLKGSLMSIPGMQFLTNPYTMMAAGIGAITKLGSQAEQTAVAFRTMTGSEKTASDMLGQIQTFANNSPFGKMDLSENARTMLNFGVNTKQVVPLLKQLGDISGGDKEHMTSLSLVLGQVSAAGKLAGQDLLQFVSAGWNPLQDLSQMSGKSMGELKDMMSKGRISFEDITKAMQHATGVGGRFHGMMQAESQTTAGRWSTLTDEITSKATNMYTDIQGPINSLLDLANQALPKVFGWIQLLLSKLVSGIKFIVKYRTEFAVLGGVIATVWGVTKAYGAALMIYHGIMTAVTVVTKGWAIAQALLNIVMSMNPIGLVIAASVALGADIMVCWNKFVGFRAVVLTVWNTLKGFGNIIKNYVIDRIRTLLSGIGKVGTALAKLFSGNFKGAWNSVKDGFKDITGMTAARRAAGATRQLVSGIGSTYRGIYRRQSAQSSAPKTKPGKSTIKQPALKGSAGYGSLFTGSGTGKKGKSKGKGKKGSRKTAEALVTGGSRNSEIHVSIGKFFDDINVTMADRTDTAELERIILQCLNRSLSIATSKDRS